MEGSFTSSFLPSPLGLSLVSGRREDVNGATTWPERLS